MSRQPSQTAEAPPGDDVLFRSIFAQSVTGITVVAAETGRFLRVNAAACAIFGTSEQELLLKSLRDITDPDDIEASDDFLLRLASGESPIPPRDLRCLRSDGSKVWVRLDVTVIRDAAGVPVCYACLMQDGTANVRAHEALQASEERFRSMLQMSSDWYWAQDAQYRFIELPGFEKRDFSPEDALGTFRRWSATRPRVAAAPCQAGTARAVFGFRVHALQQCRRAALSERDRGARLRPQWELRGIPRRRQGRHRGSAGTEGHRRQ